MRCFLAFKYSSILFSRLVSLSISILCGIKVSCSELEEYDLVLSMKGDCRELEEYDLVLEIKGDCGELEEYDPILGN